MPYIDKTRAMEFFVPTAKTEGELNYIVTQAVLNYLARTERKYADYNAAVGALECAKIELYRRLIIPYEQKKMSLNGDVY